MKMPNSLVRSAPCSLTMLRQPVGFDVKEVTAGDVGLQAAEAVPLVQVPLALQMIHNWLTNGNWIYGNPIVIVRQNGSLLIFVWKIQKEYERSIEVHLHVDGNRCVLGRMFGRSHGVTAELKHTDQGVRAAYRQALQQLTDWLCNTYVTNNNNAKGSKDGKDNKDGKDGKDGDFSKSAAAK